MKMILITGGARAGKSAYAQRRAHELGGDDVTVIATARPDDEEMRHRIENHRAERPPTWRVIEASSGAGDALRAARTPVVLLDCLTLLVSNAFLDAERTPADAPADPGDAGRVGRSEAEIVRAELAALRKAADDRAGTLLIVTNEVGLGVVPATPLGRRFRDQLGLANQRLAARADQVVFMVSGLPVTIKPSPLLSSR